MPESSRITFKEMCERFDVTPRTLRYYEYIELLAPEKEGRARFYGPREMARLKLILRGRRFGFSLEEIRQWLLIYGKVPQAVAAWIQTVAHDPVTFLLLTNAILLVIGTVIDGIPGLIMTVPILLPIATDVYGIDPRHFGVVAVINLVLGLMSPPVGLSFFVASAVTGAKPGKMFIVTLPFFIISCVALVVLSLFPSLSLGLIK